MLHLGIVDHLRRRFARFKLCAHLLQACSKRFNLLLLAHRVRFQFLNLAVLFEKLVEQHRVDLVVAHAQDFAVLVAHNQVWVYLGYFLGD